jgi:parvulin-like peptidyl-prolyl isomerase
MKKTSMIVSMMLVAVAGCQGGSASPTSPPAGDNPSVVVARPDPTPRPRGDAPAGTALAPAGTVIAPGPDDRLMASIDGAIIRQSAVTDVLIEGHGLDVLMKIVQMEMARTEAANLGVAVSDVNVKAEQDSTLRQMFPELDEAKPNDTRTPDQIAADRAEQSSELLTQLLTQQRVTRAEFDVVMRTNAYLRAIVKPQIAKKITEADLQEAFGTIYGEKARVRHIALANLQEVGEARAKLDAGQSFAVVARELSKTPATGAQGGLLSPFARNTPGMSPAFIEAAFALQPGQVSDPVQSEGFYHLIKLEEKIAPRAAKFEDVKEYVRVELQAKAEAAAMAVLRNDLAQRALRNLKIENPELKRQFDARVKAANTRQVDRNAVTKELNEKR